MFLGGLQKLSLLDYPGKVACIVFTQGCMFRCHFCHNPSLVLPEDFGPSIEESSFFSFLEKRKDKLEGVVISGGEPTLQRDLPQFMRKIKERGFCIKLDTAGVFPALLEKLLDEKFIDYIAMDIKASREKYSQVVGRNISINCIEKSISLIMKRAPDYEFRTTLLPSLHTREDVLHIFKWIKGAKRYYLQKFSPGKTVNPLFSKEKGFTLEEMKELSSLGKEYVEFCRWR